MKSMLIKPNLYIMLCCIMCLSMQGGCSNADEQGITFYVAPEGTDQNPGTRNQPLATLTGARDAIRTFKSEHTVTDTIQVLIEGGRYVMQEPLKLGVGDGGTAEFPVIYKAASDSSPQFVGGKRISGFRVDEQGIWRAKIPQATYYGWQFDQLYVNGKRADIARVPNTGFYSIEKIRETIWQRGTGRVPKRAQQVITLSKDEFEALKHMKKEEEDNVRFRAYHKWDFTIHYLDRINKDNLSVTSSGKGMHPWNPIRKGNRIYFENFEAALDAPGEWYLSKEAVLSYVPREGEIPKSSEVVAPALPHFIIVRGESEQKRYVQNIEFKELKFSYSHYKIPPEGFEPNQAATDVDAAIELEGAKNIKFQNFEITHTGQHGIHFGIGTQQCSVEHSYLHDLGGGGIYIGTDTLVGKELLTQHITVKNSIIQTGGVEFSPAVGLWIGHAANNQVMHNDIGDFRYSGTSVGWHWGYEYSPAKNNKILYNRIHHIGWGLMSDMGAVYTLGPSEGTEVSHNVIHDVYSYGYGGWGLYTDEGSSHIKMENNLVYNTKSGGFHQHYGKENIIRNNIFAFADIHQLQVTRVEDHRSFDFTHNIVVYDSGPLLAGPWDKINAEMENNLYWAYEQDSVRFKGMDLPAWQSSGKGQHSIIANPRFEEAEARNFHFASGAPLQQIGFQAFNYNMAGVLGSKGWKKKARLTEEKQAAFKKLRMNK